MISAVAGPVSSVNKPPNRMWHFRLLMRQLGQPRGSSVIPKGLAGDSALLSVATCSATVGIGKGSR